jgi:hypothetical protein
MRAFELLLWLICSGWAAWWVLSRPSRLANAGLAGMAAVIALLHLAVEGARVHMVPTYGLLVVLIGSSARRSGPAAPNARRWVRAVAVLSAGLWVLIAAALPLLFPVFSYAAPSGPYGIGTATYELPGGPQQRALVVQAWYPTGRGVSGTPVGITSRPDLFQTAYASFTGLPRPLFDNLRLVRTHALADVPMARDRRQFPIVLFSHGPLSANRSQSIFQMEALASRGFVGDAEDVG